MIVTLAALILLSTLSHSRDVPEQMLFTVAEPGDDLTLTCTVRDNEFGMLYWYKLKFGYMVQTVASGIFSKVSLQGQFTNSRFTLSTSGAEYFLYIRNVSKDDEATYFCQAGSAYDIKMLNSTLVAVNAKNQQKPDYVLQEPQTASVAPGGSVTLCCSLLSTNQDDRDQCSEQHRVYWFRAGSRGFNPGYVYAESVNSEDRGRKSCAYSFSKSIRDSSDAGIYYCAVVTCAEVLLGEGTRVETTSWLLLTLAVLLGCCVIAIICLIVSRKQKKCCEPRTAGNSAAFSQTEQDRTAENQPSNTRGETEPLSYAVLDFPSRRPKRLRNTGELEEESLYAFMRKHDNDREVLP